MTRILILIGIMILAGCRTPDPVSRHCYDFEWKDSLTIDLPAGGVVILETTSGVEPIEIGSRTRVIIIGTEAN